MGLSRTPVLVTADWVFPITSPPIAGGGLLLDNGAVADLGPWRAIAERHPGVKTLPLGPGAILPGLINAHTHLELATLDRIGADGGFSSWLRKIIAAKEDLDDDRIARGVGDAVDRMGRFGTVYAADVANIFCTAPILAEKNFPSTLFQEFIGFDAGIVHRSSFPRIDDRRNAVRMGYAAHTPFSTGPELLTFCAQRAEERNMPWSIHLAESTDEVELLEKGSGPLHDLLLDRGVARSELPRQGLGPVAYVDSLGCLDERLIAVHCVQAETDDLALLARRGVTPCVCPSSNLHLCGTLPDLDAMLAAGLEPCLGTDSPASAASLNLFEEMEILLDACVDPAIILKMATEFGAAALRLGADHGQIEKGNRPALIHLACEFDGRARKDAAAAAAALIRSGARVGHGAASGGLDEAREKIETVGRLIEELN